MPPAGFKGANALVANALDSISRDPRSQSQSTATSPGRGFRLTTEKRKEQTQDDAENNAGDDREIEGRVPALDPDVAGQTSEPTGAEPAPEEEPEEEDNGPKNGMTRKLSISL